MTIDKKKLTKDLKNIVKQYPEPIQQFTANDIARTIFHVSLISGEENKNRRVLDLGGGISLFSLACAVLGMKSFLIDDFGDEFTQIYGDKTIEKVHKKYGVHFLKSDFMDEKLDFGENFFDTITSFDSIEHWHSSPKKAFHKFMRMLKEKGVFLIGAPNCVNLRKRITVPFGIGKWSAFDAWYEKEIFRGHVREPDTEDLIYIAEDLRLKNIKIIGKNWLGYNSRFKWVRLLTPLADKALQVFPGLCSDIYVIGEKQKLGRTEEK